MGAQTKTGGWLHQAVQHHDAGVLRGSRVIRGRHREGEAVETAVAEQEDSLGGEHEPEVAGLECGVVPVDTDGEGVKRRTEAPPCFLHCHAERSEASPFATTEKATRGDSSVAPTAVGTPSEWRGNVARNVIAGHLAQGGPGAHGRAGVADRAEQVLMRNQVVQR